MKKFHHIIIVQYIFSSVNIWLTGTDLVRRGERITNNILSRDHAQVVHLLNIHDIIIFYGECFNKWKIIGVSLFERTGYKKE